MAEKFELEGILLCNNIYLLIIHILEFFLRMFQDINVL